MAQTWETSDHWHDYGILGKIGWLQDDACNSYFVTENTIFGNLNVAVDALNLVLREISKI